MVCSANMHIRTWYGIYQPFGGGVNAFSRYENGSSSLKGSVVGTGLAGWLASTHSDAAFA